MGGGRGAAEPGGALELLRSAAAALQLGNSDAPGKSSANYTGSTEDGGVHLASVLGRPTAKTFG